MGNSVQALKEAQNEKDVKAKEMLKTFSAFLVQKCAATSAKLKETAQGDQTLPIIAIVDKTEKHTLCIKQVPNEAVTSGIRDMLSGNFFSGLARMICGAIDIFLGSTSAGESEATGFHVVYANNSLLRIDYYMYQYTFSSDGILSKYENAFCFLLQIGVLDLQKVNPQVLLFELTKTIGLQNISQAAEELRGITMFAKSLYSTVKELNEAAKGFEKQSKQPLPEPGENQEEDRDEDKKKKFYEALQSLELGS